MVEMFDDNSMEHLVAKAPMTGNRCFPLSLKRFGHLNLQSLKLLQQREMVYGLPEIGNVDKLCQGCTMGKAHRESFGKEKTWKASESLELIYSDVYGPMHIITIGGNRYFLTFIDDCTRLCWVYFMQYKYEVFGIFKKFKAMVELQSSYKIKRL
ncbi:unnamed protein product [Prunus armeniaca]